MSLEVFPYGLVVAMITGWFGATFFLLIQLQTRISEGTLTDARDMWTWPLIILRCVVGVGAASILYFFFKSGLLQGSLWPELGTLGFVRVTAAETDTVLRLVPNREFALLIIWSFLAGYSESLVPTLLLNTEARMSKK